MNAHLKRPEPQSRSQRGLRIHSSPRREQAGARVLLLALTAFVAGLGVAGYLLRRPNGAGPAGHSPLSASTRSVLQGLSTSLEIRYYALLDPASVPSSTRDFAARVDGLLSEYAQAANGKLTIVRYLSPSAEAAKSASADRVKPFNLDKGDACYLGLTVYAQGHHETLAQLAPEWEQAVEPDLTRAIVRMANPPTAAVQPTISSEPDATAVDEVKRLLPNLNSVSIEEGSQTLREKTLKSFTEANAEMQARIREAEQRLAQAKNAGSAAEQTAAVQEIHTLQSNQVVKLKEISAQLQTQLNTLEYLKKK